MAPHRLRPMGSLRVGHDWATSLSLFTFMHWRRKWQPTPVFLPGESQGWDHTESDTTEVTQQQQQSPEILRERWGLSSQRWGFPSGSDSKVSVYSAGDPGSIPGSGRSPGEGNGSPLQYSCLENAMDGGAWWATVHGVTKSWTRWSNSTLSTSSHK